MDELRTMFYRRYGRTVETSLGRKKLVLNDEQLLAIAKIQDYLWKNNGFIIPKRFACVDEIMQRAAPQIADYCHTGMHEHDLSDFLTPIWEYRWSRWGQLLPEVKELYAEAMRRPVMRHHIREMRAFFRSLRDTPRFLWIKCCYQLKLLLYGYRGEQFQR